MLRDRSVNDRQSLLIARQALFKIALQFQSCCDRFAIVIALISLCREAIALQPFSHFPSSWLLFPAHFSLFLLLSILTLLHLLPLLFQVFRINLRFLAGIRTASVICLLFLLFLLRLGVIGVVTAMAVAPALGWLMYERRVPQIERWQG